MDGRAIALFALLLSASLAAATGLSVVDDSGNRVTMPSPAQSIIALAPHAAELVFAAGAGNRLVGAVEFSDYPAQARDIPRLGSASRLDRERLLALKPDLVVGWASGNRAQDLDWLRGLGIPIFLSEPRRLDQVASNLEAIGQLAGTVPAATRAARAFRQRVTTLAQRYSANPRITVFHQIWDRPLMTVGGAHIINQVLSLCGARNIFAAEPGLTLSVTREAVLAARPRAIFGTGESAERTAWRAWASSLFSHP